MEESLDIPTTSQVRSEGSDNLSLTSSRRRLLDTNCTMFTVSMPNCMNKACRKYKTMVKLVVEEVTICLVLSTTAVHPVSYVAGAYVICIVICRGEVLHQLMHSLHSASLSRLNQWNSCLPVGKLWLRTKILVDYILVLRLSEKQISESEFCLIQNCKCHVSCPP